MCGIAGYCTTLTNLSHSELLQSMIDEINHRGPDSEGVKIYVRNNEEVIGFGHKRLSIVDLTSSGIQPMESATGQTSIIFNGEIYNYQVLRKDLEEEFSFKTNTDTEVILNMYEKYGERCLEHLNGMFAFAIYDKKKDQLFIARDRLGIRPLYYYMNESEIVFSSEIKALWKFPSITKKVDYRALNEYVKSRYVSNPETLFQGIKKLQPGHYMIYKDGKLQIHEFWDIKNFEKLKINFNEAVQHVEELLLDSIRLRMISDVPVGAYLSGGIDSSLIVSMMAQQSSKKIKTFSVGFENKRYSEFQHAKKVSDLFQTDHQELFVKSSDIKEYIYKAIAFRDAPLSETADIPLYMLSVLAKKEVSVVLTGEGSDEIFAGYPKYAYDHFSKETWFQFFLNNKNVAKLMDSLPFSFRKLKLAYNALCIEDDFERYKYWFSSFGDEMAGKLFTEEFGNAFGSHDLNASSILIGKTNLDRMQYLDVKSWLTDNLLERGDRMLMAASVEGRLPFLDYRLVEFAFQLPENYKMKKLERKFIIKQLAERYLPKDIIYRKKIGFYVPIGDWFRTDLKDFLCDHLLSATFRNRGIFNNNRVERMIEMHCKGAINFEKELWMLLNLEIWFRTCVD